jgi:hypothetical protein
MTYLPNSSQLHSRGNSHVCAILQHGNVQQCHRASCLLARLPRGHSCALLLHALLQQQQRSVSLLIVIIPASMPPAVPCIT